MLDKQEVTKALMLMKPNNQLFEVRVIYENKKVYSGYFSDSETLVKELTKQPKGNCNVYITLNELNEACYDRSQKNKFELNSKATTSDNDVNGLDWLMVDLDPKRPAGTSSTDEQLDKAKKLGNDIYNFMQKLGFEKPLLASSGNGVHLLYRVCLKNSKENVQLLEKCLKTLNILFSTDDIEVDMKNFNPSRICKLYGTLAQKGTNSDKRPHRMSKVLNIDSEIKSSDRKYLEELAKRYPTVEEKPQKYNNFSPKEFDLDDWLSKHGIHYRKIGHSDGDKYILEHCPFDSNHKGKDAMIFRSRNGSIGFNCFHNSCMGKTWKDVRVLFEPDAYEKHWQEYEKKAYGNFNRNRQPKPVQPIVEKENVPVFYSPLDIYNLPQVEESFIRTGTEIIDRKMRGLKKGYVSVVSGLRSSAKSTLLSQWMAEAIDSGNNVACYSGELTCKNFMKWMNLQLAGKSRVQPGQYEGFYYVKNEHQKKIAEWLNGKFWLYNNEYGHDFKAMAEQFEKLIEEKKLDLLILDNLMSFDLSTTSEDKWEAQKLFVFELQRIAKHHNVHIAFVAHPRKAQGFLRLDDISGTADLGNAVDNAYIVHRNNADFRRLSAQMFGWKEGNDIYKGTNIVEIAKDRDGGTQDTFVPLWYEIQTKRLKNSETENRIYGWDTNNDGFYGAAGIEDIPFEWEN